MTRRFRPFTPGSIAIWICLYATGIVKAQPPNVEEIVQWGNTCLENREYTEAVNWYLRAAAVAPEESQKTHALRMCSLLTRLPQRIHCWEAIEKQEQLSQFALNANGKRLLVPMDSTTLRLVDTESGEDCLEPIKCETAIYACAISQDGKSIWMLGDLTLYAFVDNQMKRFQLNQDRGLNAGNLYISPCGRFLAALSYREDYLLLLNANTGEVIKRIETNEKGISHVEYSATGRCAIVGQHGIDVYDLESGRRLVREVGDNVPCNLSDGALGSERECQSG